MEVEDCRVRMQGVMQASASLVSFYQTWLQPGQELYLRPHYAHVLQLDKKEAQCKHNWSTATEMGVGVSVLWRVREKGMSYA